MFVSVKSGEVEFVKHELTEEEIQVKLQSFEGNYGLLLDGAKIKAVKSVVPHNNSVIVVPLVSLDSDGVLLRFSSINGKLYDTDFGIDLVVESSKEQKKVTLNDLFKIRV